MACPPEENFAIPGLPVADDARQSRRRRAADTGQSKRFAIDAACLLNDSHFEDVILLDLRGLSDITDYVLIASGTSDRQIKSVGNDVEGLAKEAGFDRYGRDADTGNTWLVLDFVDVIVHLFEPTTRAHYDLEMMWGDAPQVSWRRAG